MSKPEFFPSHRITLRSGEVEEVMLIDGAAYTRDEWESETVADYECDEAGAWTFQGEPFAGAVGEIKPPRPWPTIRNCNFAARHDDRGRHVREALTAAGRGCEDCDLIGALDNLEATLADHAESDSEESMRLCREAEEAVESAFLAPVARHEERPVEGIGWYVYVGGQDAGGPFETEADALAHWQK